MAFALSLVTARGARVLAAVVGLGVGLPLLYWILHLVLPDARPAERLVRVEVRLTDASTGLRVDEALVRVYRRVNGRELPEASGETFDGLAVIQVRPETATSSLAYLAVDAAGYAPYRASLAALIEQGETLAGDHLVEAKLEPE